ncbi:helix-turn-helix transcriptional regulator [Mycobacterium yunnanensis]|uniref:Helix-turn-helix transcriptional regulator n=1 Tax=Mycobacterium yunnanensis TaxID=368477 RepID=A0A9X3C255_9MYCO|nr:helix-turn-helix transcriptional regulator [Mycobacterium yunnanensis]MCV7422093.1 helix-turn-helix transcriptional regulator [Mycobacterium yunnanensis]
MRTVLLDTTDLAEAEAAISETFASVRLSVARGLPTRTRVVRSMIGSLPVDSIESGYTMRYEMAPPEHLTLFRMRAGVVEIDGEHVDRYGPGDVGVGGAVEGRRVTGRVGRVGYDVLTLDRSLFDRVATNAAGHVALTCVVPISETANRRVAAVVDHVVAMAALADIATHPLIVSATQNHVAATMLTAFPNDAERETTIEDRHDSTPVLLRRAIAFLEDNAYRDIALTDVAESVFVTPRALQYMFRKHRDQTPMEYLRRVRLHHVHLELIAADRAHTTVAAIARAWGFAHMGRFAVYYRTEYGESPHQTLRG